MRKELREAVAKASKGEAKGGKAEEEEMDLPPEEKLLREIMQALNKGE